MNKKIFLVVLALVAILLAAPYVGNVSAGKGETKQYYEIYLLGDSHGGPDTKYWVTADGIMQMRNYHYFATYIEVTIGTETYYPDPNSYSCIMDFTLDTNLMILYARIQESFSIEGEIITQHTAEMVTEYGTEFNGGGSFVGFGSESLEGVKIQGTTGMIPLEPEGAAIDRVGTIMGWPTP